MVEHLYSSRRTQEITWADFAKIEFLDVENIVLKLKVTNVRYQRFDLGCLIYSRYLNMKLGETSNRVVISSIKTERVEVVRQFLLEMVGRITNQASFYNHLAQMKKVFKFINKNYPETILKNEDSIRLIYKAYTKQLVDEIRSKMATNENLVLDVYELNQRRMAQVLSAFIGKDAFEVRAVAKRIISKRKNRIMNSKGVSSDVNKFTAQNLIIYETIHDAVLNGQSLPLNFNFLSTDDIEFSYKGLTQFDNAGYFGKLNINKSKFFLFSNLYLVNIAIGAFTMLFAAVTGVNPSVLFNLKVNDFKIVPSTKGRRAYASKSRAQEKAIPIEFGVKFVSLFNKYLEFRKYLLTNYSEFEIEDINNSLIFQLSTGFHTSKSSSLLTIADSRVCVTYKHWLEKNLPNINWFTFRSLRMNVSNCYLNLSNDSVLTAEKLGNTPKQISRSYSGASFEEVSEQLSIFLSAVEKSAIDRSRRSNLKIDVEFNVLNSSPTPIGHCNGASPIKKGGFTEHAITPNCSRVESCLFCENYVVHTDVDDIRKLLSVKSLFNYINNKSDDTVIQIIYRIDEIFTLLVARFPHLTTKIEKISSEVEEGFVDKYWEFHLDLLIKLGVV